MWLEIRGNRRVSATRRPPFLALRLKFTLICGLILTVTLIVFGTVSYGAIEQASTRATGNTVVSDGAILAASLSNTKALPAQSTQLPTLPDTAIQFRHPDGATWLRTGSLTTALPLDSAAITAIRAGTAYGPAIVSVGESAMVLYTLPVARAGRLVGILQVARPTWGSRQSLDIIFIALLVGCAGATLLLFGVAWLIAGIVLRPADRG